MNQIIRNLELIQLQINKLVEEKGIFVLGNPFLKALLNTTIEDLKNLQIKETADFYGIETNNSGVHTINGKPLTDVKELFEPRPFDKLKGLWDEWQDSKSKDFEAWAYFEKLSNQEDNVHKWLAEHCGFLTTAEVRQAIQELKNQ